MRYSKNKFSSALKATAVAVSTLALTGCLASTVTQGTGGSAVSGAAGGGTSAGASNSLERCDQTLGTLAVDDLSLIHAPMRVCPPLQTSSVIQANSEQAPTSRRVNG